MTTITLYPGQTLRVSADAYSYGRVYRHPLPGGIEYSENYQVPSGAVVDIGPFLALRIYNVASESHRLDVQVLVQDLSLVIAQDDGTLNLPGDNNMPVGNYVHLVSPGSGETVAFPESAQDGTIFVDEVAIAELTISFPSDAVTRRGQLLTIAGAGTVDALVLIGATVLGAIEYLSPGDSATYQKVKESTWIRKP